MIPADHKCYCEPFVGGAWVFFRKEPSKCEVINDADGQLVNLWRVLQNHPEEFLRHYRYAVVSREEFLREQKKVPETLTDVQRAVRYYYLQRLAFGGKTHKRTFGTSATQAPRLNLMTMEETLLDVHFRLARVTIENLDACECIRRYDRKNTFFYIDPPYWHTAGYAVPFKDADFIRVRDTLTTIKGRFLLSINDAPAVRNIFKGFKIQSVATTYSIGNPRSAPQTHGTERPELLIQGP